MIQRLFALICAAFTLSGCNLSGLENVLQPFVNANPQYAYYAEQDWMQEYFGQFATRPKCYPGQQLSTNFHWNRLWPVGGSSATSSICDGVNDFPFDLWIESFVGDDPLFLEMASPFPYPIYWNDLASSGDVQQFIKSPLIGPINNMNANLTMSINTEDANGDPLTHPPNGQFGLTACDSYLNGKNDIFACDYNSPFFFVRPGAPQYAEAIYTRDGSQVECDVYVVRRRNGSEIRYPKQWIDIIGSDPLGTVPLYSILQHEVLHCTQGTLAGVSQPNPNAPTILQGTPSDGHTPRSMAAILFGGSGNFTAGGYDIEEEALLSIHYDGRPTPAELRIALAEVGGEPFGAPQTAEPSPGFQLRLMFQRQMGYMFGCQYSNGSAPIGTTERHCRTDDWDPNKFLPCLEPECGSNQSILLAPPEVPNPVPPPLP